MNGVNLNLAAYLYTKNVKIFILIQKFKTAIKQHKQRLQNYKKGGFFMRVKKMVLFCIGFLIVFMIPSNANGEIKLVDNFFFYGFVKLDAHIQDSGMNSIIAARYANEGDGNTALTAMNTRFGFKWNIAELASGWKIAAQAEWDLFDSSANQMRFRTRHANFTLAKENSKFLFGQFWDVFGPIGPTTLNTNGYLWQTGNVGFRRAQIRYTYSTGIFNIAVSINDPTSAEARSTYMPILESRIGLNLGKKGKIMIGVSGVYGSESHNSAVVVDETETPYENDVNILGVCLDWTIPFSKFTFMGEFTVGQNLKNFLSKAHVYDNAAAMEIEGAKVTAFWTELVYHACKKFTAGAGYAFESLDEEQLGNGALNDTNGIFVGIKYMIGSGVSFGLEYTNYISKYLTADNQKTNQFILSCIYAF